MGISKIIDVSSLVLGVLGSLYLSYDLLGKPGGLLRRVTVGITSALFFLVAWPLVLLEVRFQWLPTFFLVWFTPWIVGVAGFVQGFLLPSPRREGQKNQQWAVGIMFASSLTSIVLTFVTTAGLVIAIYSGTLVVVGLNYGSKVATVLGVNIALLAVLVVLYYFALKPSIERIEQVEAHTLGGIGAVCTLLAFALQLALALSG